MPYINDTAFDAALDVIRNNADRLDICYTQEPTTATEARTTYSCGNKSLTIGAPEAGDTSGRKVVVPAITDGSVTASQTAAYWAVSNATVLHAAGALSSSQAVTSGNQFTLPAFDITFPDAT